ncbi:rve domain protein [Streptococcus pneumoniae]|nr:rve domain protein [Streptococcus pneumoniae]
MFYGYEKSFQSLKQLEQAIVDYIDYYNNRLVRNLVHFIIDDGTN